MPKTYDVCIVGSGPGGGIAAYALATAGLKVALVEMGPRLRAGIDYNPHLSPYDHLDERLSKGLRSPISGLSDYNEVNHFTGVGDRPRHGQLRALGGRSLCWAGHSLRFGPLDFSKWPIPYSDVAPYYSRAERLMGVSGAKDGLSNMPDGDFQKPVAFRCAEQMFWRGVQRLKAQGQKMEFVGIRKAIPTEQRPGGRAKCHYCGHCMRGCEIDSKYTSANTPIPKALRTGNLTLHTGASMTKILMSKDGSRAEGIVYRDATGEQTLMAKSLVLACSAVETARHLLINNICNSSGWVGRGLTSHFGVTVNALFPELKGRDYSNDEGTQSFHGLLTAMYWDKPNPNFEGTYQVQSGGGLRPHELVIRDIPGFGSDWKRKIREYNAIHGSMNMQGSLLISSKKFVDLDPAAKDKNGLALPRIHLHYEDSDIAMAKDMVDTCEQIIRTAGGDVYSKPKEINSSTLVIDSNHWVGTARMGRDKKTSVVNTDGQTHDVKNIFINDASVFAHYPEKNPTLTNIALSWRTSEKLVQKFKRREIA